MNYTELIPGLVNAIQEQQNTIETMQSELTQLKAEVQKSEELTYKNLFTG